MLYIGHFSFNGSGRFPELGDEPEHGHFTTMVEAESIEQATEKFESLIMKTRHDGDLFSSVSEVYLDSCSELKRIPPEGVISHFEAILGEAAPAMSVPLPGVDETVGQAFAIEQGDIEAEGANGEGDDDEDDRIPFIVFE
ncbi:MAG: hypothetical protein U0V87_06720 [Acidobacteriota bacterium]